MSSSDNNIKEEDKPATLGSLNDTTMVKANNTIDTKLKYLEMEAILGKKLDYAPDVIPDDSARFCARKPFTFIDNRRFKNIDEFKEKAQAYFEGVDKLNDELETKWYSNSNTRSKTFKRKPYILQGLALALGFNSMKEFKDFGHMCDIKRFPDSRYKDYYALFNRMIMIIDGTLQSGAISEDYNNKAVENYSRNHLGYSDRAMGLNGENHMREIKINIVSFNNRDEAMKYKDMGGKSEELKRVGLVKEVPLITGGDNVIDISDAKVTTATASEVTIENNDNNKE